MINMYFTKTILESVHGVNGSMLGKWFILMETVSDGNSWS